MVTLMFLLLLSGHHQFNTRRHFLLGRVITDKSLNLKMMTDRLTVKGTFNVGPFLKTVSTFASTCVQHFVEAIGGRV